MIRDTTGYQRSGTPTYANSEPQTTMECPMTVNLNTGEFYKARKEDYITKSTTVAPRDIPIPIWRSFLDKITASDAELQKYLQRMAGYCLTGDTNEDVMFFFYGTGANRKSVFINALVEIWGDYAAIAPMTTFMATHTD